MENVREPYVAGAFYPDDEESLLSVIGPYIENKPEDFDYKKIIGVIVPHAGYTYSGKTAGYAYNIIKHYSKKRFLIIGPNHYGYPFYPAIYPDGFWNTPLGNAVIDSSFSDKLVTKSDIIKDDKEAHSIEHSIEVQIPFLQYLFNNNFKFTPIILGKQNIGIARDLSETILSINDKPFIIISSDMNHYLPANRNDENDNILINDIINLKVTKFYEDIEKYHITACGYGAIATLMLITKNMKGKIRLLNHSNSGDANNDYKRVVGYSSMVAYIE